MCIQGQQESDVLSYITDKITVLIHIKLSSIYTSCLFFFHIQ